MLNTAYWNPQTASTRWAGLEKIWSIFKVTLRQATLTADAKAPVRPEEREGWDAGYYASVYDDKTSRFPYGQIFMSEDQQRMIYVPLEVDLGLEGEKEIEYRVGEFKKARYVNLAQDEIEKLVVTKKSYSKPTITSKSIYGPAILANHLGEKPSPEDLKWVVSCRENKAKAAKILAHITLG